MPKSTSSKRSKAKTGSSNESSASGAVTMNSTDGPGKSAAWEITAEKRASGRQTKSKGKGKVASKTVVEDQEQEEHRLSIASQTSTEERRQMELQAGGGDDDEMPPPTIEDIMYAVNSFSAVMWPVALTMVLAALAVVFINDGNNGDSTGGGSLFPTAAAAGGAAASTGAQLGAAVVNALTIIGVITGVTFLMVFLYYIGKIWILLGWLVLSTGMLLSFTTSLLFMVFYEKYQIPMDIITHYFMAYNFAIVGVLAIFYQKGIPRIFNQGYLVCVSVTMAWLLLRFLPEWTSWALLIALSFYDLCAVLTPCGPLKCLVNLAQEKDDPLPGLLYEADVRENQNIARHFAQMARDEPSGAGAGAYASDGDIPPPPPVKPSNRTGSSGSSVSMNQSNATGLEMIENGQEMDRDADVEQGPGALRKAVHGVGGGLTGGQVMVYDRSIKLGLGDFVFYSVLTGRSALNGFPTAVAVILTVLFGLAGTLVLLSVFNKALPALPISILLGVPFYFLTEIMVGSFSEFINIKLIFV